MLYLRVGWMGNWEYVCSLLWWQGLYFAFIVNLLGFKVYYCCYQGLVYMTFVTTKVSIATVENITAFYQHSFLHVKFTAAGY